MSNPKEYYITIRIDSGQFLEADSKEEAAELVKALWEEEYNIDLQDSEIVSIEEVDEDGLTLSQNNV